MKYKRGKLLFGKPIGSAQIFYFSEDLCVEFFPTNGHHHNWQPINQSFGLSVIIGPIGQFDQFV